MKVSPPFAKTESTPAKPRTITNTVTALRPDSSSQPVHGALGPASTSAEDPDVLKILTYAMMEDAKQQAKQCVTTESNKKANKAWELWR